MKKKLIAGMTSAALIASLSAPAFAANFPDVKGSVSESAVAQLKALRIVNGDVNGNFNPDATITRAEFAKIAIQVAGLAQAADFTGINVAPFKDVPAGHWAAGYIQVAKDAGIVKGVGDDNYAPNAPVKYEEVVAVLSRILGYDDNLPGVWPSEYVIKATELKLLSKTKFQLSQPATRGDVALIAAATLSQPTVAYYQNTNSFIVNTVPRVDPITGNVYNDAVTLIDKNFATAVKKGTLTGAGSLIGSSLQADEVSVSGSNAGTYKVAADVALVGGTSVSGLVGHEVDFITDEDGTVLYMADATVATNVVSGAIDKLDAATSSLYVGTVQYYYTGSTKFIVNNSDDSTVADIANKDTVTAVVYTGTDGKKYFSTAFVSAYEPAAIVEVASAKTAVSPAKINAVSLDDKTVITLNGQPATIADIQKGDVYYVYYAKDAVATVNSGQVASKVEVFRTTVTGKVTATGTDADGSVYYIVNGTKYVKNSSPNFTVSVTAGNEYTFTLDRDGKVVAAKQNTSVNSNKYYVMDAQYPVDSVVGTEVKNGNQKFTVLKADGTTATFFAVRNSADTAANFTVTDAAYEGKFITFEFNDKGEVTAVAQPTVSSDVYLKSDGGVDATTKKLVTSTDNAYYVTDSTVIIEDSQGPSKATKIGFDALKNGQRVTLVADPDAQQNLLAVIVHDPTGTNAGLADVTGVFVGTKTVTEANSTGGTTTTTYAVVNVDGSNQELKLEAGYTGASNTGDLVTVQDSETDVNGKKIGDGTYDKLVAPTVIVSQAVYNDTTAANAFTYNSVGYVYTSATKVYVVQFSGATYTDTANRDAATVGNIADFTQLYGQAFDAAKFGVEFKTDGTQIAGRNVVDTIVVYLKK